VPVVVDTIHVAHELLSRYTACMRNPAQRLYTWMEYRKMRRWELEVCSGAAAIWACSQRERAVFEEFCPGVPVAMVPNAIDVDTYSPAPERDDLTLLYTGIMDWYPNLNAAEFLCFEILPHFRRLVPGAKLRIAGRCDSARILRRFARIPGVEFRGTVPEMRDELAEATVCVVPLRIGSGTRLKILEAAAMAKPIVSTRLGAEGLEFVDGEEIVLADQPEAFARAVADLLADPSRRRALGQGARRRVEQQYSLTVLRKTLRQALAGLENSKLPANRKPLMTLSPDGMAR
jgi:polysaccharide biosynthesis protein PslH